MKKIYGKSVLELPRFTAIEMQRVLNEKKSLEIKVKAYEKALNKIRTENGLQYTDFFNICDEVLARFNGGMNGRS